ncbi:MAG: NusA N-terminal domain-containing protein, partial [Bacteroidota bacterium]
MKKVVTRNDHTELVDAFSEFKDLKNIDRASMMSILEDVFKNMIKKKYGSADNFDIVINTDKGDLEAFRNRLIVDDGSVEDPNTQIEYSEAVLVEPDFEVGEEVSEKIRFSDFGRRAVLAARQNLMARVQELEKEGIFQKYKNRIGEIITGEVYQVWKKEMLIIDDEGNELILPKSEQIPADFFKKGDSVRSVVLRVEMLNGTPRIILSRTSPLFLEKLFELEVPEV